MRQQSDSEAAYLTSRFREALIYAAQLHARQLRKVDDDTLTAGRPVPYIAHLLGVTSIALDYGATEDEAIAALLHDAVEDQGGKPTLERIQHLFGEEVARIVEGCTDTDVTPKPPWRERKEAYIARVRRENVSVRMVSASDKLHNARAILMDYRKVGERVWRRFSAEKGDTLWYYQELVKAFHEADERDEDPRTRELVKEFDRVFRKIISMASQAEKA